MTEQEYFDSMFADSMLRHPPQPMTEYYAGFTDEDIEFLESIGRDVSNYRRSSEMRLFYRSPSLDDVAEYPEDSLVCVLCGEQWGLEHVCWQVEMLRAITRAYSFVRG